VAHTMTTADQLKEVQVRHLEQILDAERRIKAAAEERAADAIKALYDIAAAYCSEALDAELREHKMAVQNWTVGQWSGFIHRNLGPRVNIAIAGERLGQQFEAAQKQVEALQAQVDEIKQELEQQIARNRALENELAASKASLQSVVKRATDTEVTTPAADLSAGQSLRVVKSPGAWFDEWKAARGFDRSRDLVQLIGQTGLCRRPVLQAMLNQQWGVSRKQAVSEAVELSDQYGLIETMTVDQAQGQPQVIKLSERGQQAFSLIFNADPVASEWDELIKRHKSAEHMLLNLAAADMLRERLKATVDLYPPMVVLSGGRQFAPDLMVILPDGDIIYVECERSASHTLRDAKWRNVHDATGGRFYVICPDKKVRQKVESEISLWMAKAGVPGELNATDMAALSENKGSQFWVTQKSKK